MNLPQSQSVGIQVVPKLERKNAKVQVRVKRTDKGMVIRTSTGKTLILLVNETKI